MVQANTPPLDNNNGDAPPKCPKCSKVVFMAEARVAGKFKWHVTCFTCRELWSFDFPVRQRLTGFVVHSFQRTVARPWTRWTVPSTTRNCTARSAMRAVTEWRATDWVTPVWPRTPPISCTTTTWTRNSKRVYSIRELIHLFPSTLPVLHWTHPYAIAVSVVAISAKVQISQSIREHLATWAIYMSLSPHTIYRVLWRDCGSSPDSFQGFSHLSFRFVFIYIQERDPTTDSRFANSFSSSTAPSLSLLMINCNCFNSSS